MILAFDPVRCAAVRSCVSMLLRSDLRFKALRVLGFRIKQIDPELSDSALKVALYYWLLVDATSNPFVRMHLQSDPLTSSEK